MQVREIKTEAKERFALNRYHAMLVYGVVFTLALNIAVITTVMALLNIWAIWYGIILIFLFFLMLAPFGFGMTAFYLKLYRYEKMDAFHIFDGFNKYNLERVVVLKLLKTALWLAFTVLLIVPGIIFSIRTSMATYLLCANPKMKPKDALKASNRIMKGHSGKYFHLSISFIGWWFMGLVTCGLGYIWVAPYFNTAKVVFYKRELQGDKTIYRNPADELPQLHRTGQTQEETLRRKLLAELVSLEARSQMQSQPPVQNEQQPPNDEPTVASVADNQLSFADWNTAQNWSMTEKVTYEPDTVELPTVQDPAAQQHTPIREYMIEQRLQQQAPEEHPAPSARSQSVQHVRQAGQPSREQSDKTALASGRRSEQHARAERAAPQPAPALAAPAATRPSQRGQEPTMRQKESKPLPGGRVVLDSRGERVVARRQPLAGTALPDRATETPPVEIGENGENKGSETVQERLLRLRAERAAKEEQNERKKNVEIGENDA